MRLPMRIRLFALLVVVAALASCSTWFSTKPLPLDPFALELLGASEQQLATLAAGSERGLIELAPIHLPVDPPGDCNHYGWPIGTMVGDTIVVMHRRIPGHWGPETPRPVKDGPTSAEPNERMSYGVILRSTDGGMTWSEPYDLRRSMRSVDRYRGGVVPLSHRTKFAIDNKSLRGYKIHLHSIGTTRDGAVLAMNNHGVFRSEDQGCTWSHFSKTFRDDTFPHELVNLGPRILDDPDEGLMAFGNWYGPPGQPTELEEDLRKAFLILKSPDGGATWVPEEHDSMGYAQYEGNAIRHGDAFYIISRNSLKQGLLQVWYRPGEPVRIVEPNMAQTRDTSDLIYNPVTKRFEVVQSARKLMSMILWSIAPEEWFTGKWRKECVLFRRRGRFLGYGLQPGEIVADGFHAGGGVLDSARGVQHIFFYTGHPNGPAGVFRLTRTLDTPALVSFLKEDLRYGR